jgi:hypothetical protein
MRTVRLLHDVANDKTGAVIVVDDRRARQLIVNGYAVEVVKKKPKD